MTDDNNSDKYLWLEEVESEKALKWVSDLNKRSTSLLESHPVFNEFQSEFLKISTNKDKIPYVHLDGEYVYNLWNDETNPQGLYRKTLISEFLKATPDWETIIDLDQLSREENIQWVFQDFELNDDKSKALITLSPGGSDANVVREFNTHTKKIIKDGFYLPESKGHAHWVDDNTIRISRHFGDDSMTNSGYPRTIRDWSRGQKLSDSIVIYEIDKEKVLLYSNKVKTTDKTYFLIGHLNDFFNREEFIYNQGQLTKLNLPTRCEDFGIVKNQYIARIKENWNEYKAGDVLALNLDTQRIEKLISPMKNQSIYAISRTLNGFYVIVDEDVKGKLFLYSLNADHKWSHQKIDLPETGSINTLSTDYQSVHFFVDYCSFNQPTTYYYGKKDKIVSNAKTSPSSFNHQEISVEQFFSTSLDGTRVPYFLVKKNGLKYDGTNPTIMYGYGGFEVSMKPFFSNIFGTSWLARGGVFVLTNIRGGGEYGPEWHQSAVKEKRHKAYEDFYSIAEDLISKKITSAKHLGAMGGSNGGLLMGVCYTQRPDLFNALSCGVPLLDMRRYHKLLAGASWIAEYGDPEDEQDGAYIRSLSPYHNIKKDEDYPMIFLNTSTKDDRVHPAHARKFAARLLDYNHPFNYYENILGGHVGASNIKESSYLRALEMSFFWTHLK